MGALSRAARITTARVQRELEVDDFTDLLLAALETPEVQAALAKAVNRQLSTQASSRPPVSARDLKHRR